MPDDPRQNGTGDSRIVNNRNLPMPQPTPARFTLAHSTRTPMPGAVATGPADATQTMTVSLRLRRNPAAPPLPRPGAQSSLPVRGRTHLTREDFAKIHGTTPADFAAIQAFATAHGLTVTSTESGRRTAVLSGTPAQLGAAFGVTLQQYHTGKTGYISHEGEVTMPAALTGIVESVHGLDTRPIGQPMIRPAPEGITSLGISPLLPAQVAKLYGFPTNSASGQTIGIIEYGGGYLTSDIQHYFNNIAHLPVPSVSSVSVNGATNNFSPNDGNASLENALDIAVAGSVAPGAKLVVYFAPGNEQGWLDSLLIAIHDTTNKPSVISISWGGPESDWGLAMSAISPAFIEAAALGVTVFIASGDFGAGSPADVYFPASDPGVTGCGGTTISNVSGTSFSQAAWSGSGGGVSGAFALPEWQSRAGVPASKNPAGHIGRGVPDIAGNADNLSGYMLAFNGGTVGPVGGTSAVAPLYAGLAALLNASLGEPLGFLNANLYTAEGPYAFDDVTTGNNNGYNAGPGWDPVTGLGSINGSSLATTLMGIGLPPALTMFQNNLYMAWKGMEFDDGIYFTHFNGSGWAPQTKVGSYGTSAGVSLAVFNNLLYMAWKGESVDQGIWYASFNGTSWSPQQQVANVATSTGPRLAVYGGKLYMAWKGMEDNQGLWFSSFNGTSWAPQQQIPGVASSVGPALVTLGNLLYAAWKGEFGDPGLYYATFNGNSWSAQKQIANTGSSEGPSLAVLDNQIYAVWKGEFSDQRLWWSALTGLGWTPQRQIAGVYSSVGPGLGAFNNQLVAAWKGMNGDQRIWYSTYGTNGWSAQQIVPNVGTSTDLLAAE
jgi:kumamolisin